MSDVGYPSVLKDVAAAPAAGRLLVHGSGSAALTARPATLHPRGCTACISQPYLICQHGGYRQSECCREGVPLTWQEVQRMWGGQLEAAGALEAAACCFLQSGAPAAAVTALGRRGTAGAVAAAAKIAAAAAVEADPAAGVGSSSSGSELRQLADQLRGRAAATAGSSDPASAKSAAAETPVETDTKQLRPAGAVEARVVVVGSSTVAGGAAAATAPSVAMEAEPQAAAAASAGRTKHSLSNGTGHPAADVAPAAKQETIPMSRALAMRPWQLPGYRAAASAAPDNSGSGISSTDPRAFERRRYSRDQLLGVCGGMAVGKTRGQAFVATDTACARAAELDILLPELPPPPPPPLALP